MLFKKVRKTVQKKEKSNPLLPEKIALKRQPKQAEISRDSTSRNK